MTNKTIIKFTRNKIKELLAECTDEQQLLFKRMYGDVNSHINYVVDTMSVEKLDHALTQVEQTIEKKCHSKTTPPCYKIHGGCCEDMCCEH